ncbi:filamentous hemagglutinin N-terminal domain-containing protein [Ferribacterium limneticum]|uniref:filamentous hemagglutinin N-terminal domain-containing protein n=1 Tax=Ferribacterium limneticum TaxID=76259 RepID=UPI001CFBA131|nr:filamentous hemagglutinin N-terminal domain-containing protein [Ferribacterium limneticum]UCV17958.1 filamentous hemagglutinin N-terminal domain-containing protein [Ferribacterium limneticum]
MNHGIYRLIFNSERNSWVAVAENVRGRGKKSNRRRVAAVVLGLAAAAGGEMALAAGRGPLPVPSTAVGRPFVFSGAVTGGQPSTVGNTMTINTDSRTLGLNWKSFDIASGYKVEFAQPDSTSRVLNRIWDNSPSQIMGQLKANGQVYLINQNGILFGAGAEVNVGGLVASALGMSETMMSKLLATGLPTTKGDSLTFAYGAVAGEPAQSTVVVETGARITAADGGKVVLIAPKSVDNQGFIGGAGSIETILAAGGKVIVTAPDEPSLRGLLVETQAATFKDSLGSNATLDGTATNSGHIDTGPGGVVTLAALAVNQKGIVNATKAVNLNGTTMLVSGSTETDLLTVNQRGSVAEIDWVSGFGVGAGKAVEFVQSSTGSVAYNYVYDPDRTAVDGLALNRAGRTSIDGILKANGQFVLINEKGIDFGSNARVSANNFVASALGMNPNIVGTGLLGQKNVNTRAFYLNARPTKFSENDPALKTIVSDALATVRQATIKVQSGAQIESGSNGYVILAGMKIDQVGQITSDNGQALLAAGADLYLKPGYSSFMRGFTAEVNPFYMVRDDVNKSWVALSRNDDANAVINRGTISVPFGDITLVGHEITQAGILRASTSVTSNGSIHLVARDQLNTQDEGVPAASLFYRQYGEQGVLASTSNSVSSTADDVSAFVTGQVGGKLTFAPGSQTVIDIDGRNKKTLTADQTFIKSSIEAVASKIVVADADIEARGGNIRLNASEKFGEFSAFATDPLVPERTATPQAGVGIFVDDGARIDASGVDASGEDQWGTKKGKSVADLFIEVELRGDEFADNAVQRSGTLRGQKAWVDIRDKVSIANLDGWVNKVGQTVFEKAATGGEVSLGSTGSVIVKSGSTLDVSGGKVDFAASAVQESIATAVNGKSYRLNDAPTSIPYLSLTTVSRNESAYVEGKSAGTVSLSGHSLAVDGNLLAKTTVGTRQREMGDPSSNRYAVPYGGRLIVKDFGQHYVVQDRDLASQAQIAAVFDRAQISFVKGAATAASGLKADDAAGPKLELSELIADAGFSRFEISSEGRIDIPTEVTLDLAAGGSFSASGRQIYVAGDISAPSGKIALSTLDMSGKSLDAPSTNEAKYSTLLLDSGSSLSTAGVWVNDYLGNRLSKMAKSIDGGSVSLVSAYDIDLRAGSAIDVSGGGWVNSSGKLTAGNAGSIKLATGGVEGAAYNFGGDGDLRDASLFLDGTLSAYALGKGGKLTVETSAITLGEKFAEDSRAWSRSDRLEKEQVGAAFDAGFVDRGGFFSFSFVGRDGVTVLDRAQVSPDPVSWSLAGLPGYRFRSTSSAVGSFAQSVALHPELRAGLTSLSLATRSREFGDLHVGEGAYLGVSAQGSIDLVSMAQLTVLGTLEAPAGQISLRRPKDYDEKVSTKGYNQLELEFSDTKQSESIYLGSNSRLLAAGTTVLSADTRSALESGATAESLLAESRYKGSVLNGGTVSLDAGFGYLVTREGSQIDVSGASVTLNAATSNGQGGVSYPAQTVGSTGGTVNFKAREGMLIDGGFAATGKQGALGGTFTLSFIDVDYKSNPWDIDKPENGDFTAEQLASMADRQLTLYQSTGGHAANWLLDGDGGSYLAGDTLLNSLKYNGQAALDLALLTSGGFGSWSLTSQHEMRFSGAITATANNQLKLLASKFSAADDTTVVTLTAAAAQIGNIRTGATASTASIGNAKATINALDIGLVGTFDWNGFGTTKFVSQGEIHFDSVGTSVSDYKGQMSAAGDLTFSAARLSPSTYSNFRVDLLADPNSSISITRPEGAVADVSLSAAGRLEFAAPEITHEGTISAPLGEIVFSAPGGKVTLKEGSITSVAADRDLLLGYTTESGTAWKYLGSKITALPNKGVRIDASDTVVASGAKLDLSGGGDALAWEFTAGPGGKTDVLKASSQTFAIVPGWSGFTATDGELQQGYLSATGDLAAPLKAGDRIALADNPAGLNGSYVLLPARYAVLPGAYLVTVTSSKESVLGRVQTQADGSWLVAGSRLAVNFDGTTTTTTAYSATPLTLELASSSVVATRAAYVTTKASQFFYDVDGAKLPGDAGQLTAIGRNSLVFDPAVVAMRVAEISAADGRQRAGSGLEVDLAAPKLRVTDNAGTGTANAGWSVLDQEKLNALGASSILIGGARTVSGMTTTIESVASDVEVNNSHGALSVAEIMMTATDRLTVTENSRIESIGSADVRDIRLSGDGAFMRVAESGQAALTRVDGTVQRAKGDLNIETGASIAGQSLIFDATRNTALDGMVSLGSRRSDGSRESNGAIAIGAGRLNVVGDGSTPADGLTLDNAYLARFATGDQLRLTSYSTLDLYGNAVLGSASLKELIVTAAGVAGHGDAGSVAEIAAQSVRFINPEGSSSFVAGDTLGGGRLGIQATMVEFGENATATGRKAETAGFAIRGFSDVDVVASGDVRFAGIGVTAIDNVDGSGNAANLNIDAARVVTVGTADHLLVASGATTITRNAKASTAESDVGLGGTLDLRGKSLDVSGKIDVAGGTLTLSGTDYLKVLKDAFVGAEGKKVAFDDTYAYASGGRIALKSQNGDVTVQDGAVVSVSADPDGGNAGSLLLVAPQGTVSAAEGTLRGAANEASEQGLLTVDAKSLDLDALTGAVIDNAGTRHFTAGWDIRRRSGDLTLNKEIKADAVKLAADAGNIDIAGIIDASGNKGGTIELYANRAGGVGGWVNLKAGSQLKAYAEESVGAGQGTKGQGGTVIVGVSASDAADDLATGISFDGESGGKAAASIDVSTAVDSTADKGKVIFRAPRQDTLGNLTGFDGAIIVSNDALASVLPTSYVVSPSTAVSTLGWGTTVSIRLSASSIAQATLDLSGLGSKNVLRADGTALSDNDLVSATTGKVLVFDGSTFRISPTAASAIPATPASAALTSGAYQVSGSAPVAWGMTAFKAAAANLATTQIKVAGKSYALLGSNGSPLAAGAIKKDQNVLVVFDGTAFRVSPTTHTAARTVNLATGPTATQYRVDSASTVAGLVSGSVVTFTATAQATAGATLKVGGNSAVVLLKADGTPLDSEVKESGVLKTAATFEAGQSVVAVFDGSAFRISTLALKDTGTVANTYKVTPTVKPVSNAEVTTDGYTVTFRARQANTGAGKLTVVTEASTSGTTINLKQADGSALKSGDIKNDQLLTAVYNTNADGTGEFRLVGGTELASAPVTDSAMATVNLQGNISGAASVALEAVNTTRKSGEVVLGTDQQRFIVERTAQAAALKGKSFVAVADAEGRLEVVFRPGEEIRSTGDISVSGDWDFSSARYASQPGTLSLRAGGDLNVAGTLNDGFGELVTGDSSFRAVSRDAQLASSGDSWSFRLVAGADSAQAQPMATRSETSEGSILIGTNKLVRTGTGTIEMAASKDIKLFDRAAIYTAGVDAATQPDGFVAASAPSRTAVGEKSAFSMFPSGGGDISLTAGEDILMVKSGDKDPDERHINEWLFRAGGKSASLQWWSRIASFQQGVAAFGGGDVKVTAGREVSNLVVALPTNGRVPQIDGVSQPDSAVVQGGGDLTVRTPGTITGGLFYVENGVMRIDAGALKFDVGLALGNAPAIVTAKGDIELGNVFNPLWVDTDYVYNTYNGEKNLAGNKGTVAWTNANKTNNEYDVRFGTYGENTKLDVVSAAGDVALNGKGSFFGKSDDETHRLMPSRVKVAALNGDIEGSVAQASGKNGQLDLLAQGSISLTDTFITQLDVPAELLPSVRNPLKNTGINGRSGFSLIGLLSSGSVLEQHSATGWHADDTEPSRLVALNGDIVAKTSDFSKYSQFNEAVRVVAGGDVTDFNVSIQHAHAGDVSSIVAGGDVGFAYQTTGEPGKVKAVAAHSLGIEVTGPGSVEVDAGGTVDLADTGGIVSRGNLENPYLPEGGASVLVAAGATPDYESLRVFLKVGKEIGNAELRMRFFTLLREYGKEAQKTGDESYYEKGRLLAQALFPSEKIGRGDIKLSVSQIKTEQGGGIHAFAPGGSIQVGVAVPTLEKKASQQGIFTIRDGEIFAYVANNFLVNQSRVFTLDGGDIMIWADKGDINAGSGSKTQISTPPPVLVIRDGQIVLDTSNSISGSGIGVLASRDDTQASDMSLFAPEGAIDAGDAGLRSTGNITLGARVVLNANNIQASGNVSGAPAPVTAAAPVAAVTNPTNNENKALEEVAPAAGKRDGAGGMLTVEVLDSEPATAQTPATTEPSAPAKAPNNDDERKPKSSSAG